MQTTESAYETIIAPEWGKFIRVLRNDQKEPTVFSCNTKENIPSIFQTLGPMNFMFGRYYIGDYVYLPDFLRKLDQKAFKFSDHSQNQKELRFVHSGYQHRMLFNVDTFALVLYENRALSKVDEYETENYSLEVVENKTVNGRIVPSRFIVTILSAGGISGSGKKKHQVPSTKTTYEYSLDNIQLDSLSEKDFQFSLSLPNGTPAVLKDVPQIEYVWLDGKIIPKTDEVMLAIARGGHKFMPGPNESRFWMMSVGVALIIFACGKKGYDYYKSRKVL